MQPRAAISAADGQVPTLRQRCGRGLAPCRRAVRPRNMLSAGAWWHSLTARGREARTNRAKAWAETPASTAPLPQAAAKARSTLRALRRHRHVRHEDWQAKATSTMDGPLGRATIPNVGRRGGVELAVGKWSHSARHSRATNAASTPRRRGGATAMGAPLLTKSHGSAFRLGCLDRSAAPPALRPGNGMAAKSFALTLPVGARERAQHRRVCGSRPERNGVRVTGSNSKQGGPQGLCLGAQAQCARRRSTTTRPAAYEM